MKNLSSCALIALAVFLTISSCKKDVIDDKGDNLTSDPVGTLHVVFRLSHPWIPIDRIVRTELHIATSGVEIYKGNYIQSANLTDFQEEYFFYLSPGTYYYEAAIACICEGDSCSAGGFPGNQWGSKHTMDKFDIAEDEVTTVIPTFQ